jgi:Big-like domain-containing protein
VLAPSLVRFRSVVVAVAVLGVSVLPARIAVAATTFVDCGTQNLQTAINNAASGDTLSISGTCVGLGGGSAFTINAKSLTLAGAPHATLQPSGSARVLLINGPANVTLSDLTITGGTTSADGGGIDNLATLTVSRTTVRGNAAPGGYGGGIANGASLTLTHSTVSGNTASAGSGAVDNLSTLVVRDSTLFGNTVTAGYGGAVYNGGGTASFTNSTIVNNSSSLDGGGIYNGATMSLAGTIVAGNLGSGAPGTRDCSNPSTSHVSSGGYNFIGQCNAYVPASTDLVGQPNAPMAGFGDYGGPTQSAPPGAASALIDAIPSTTCALLLGPGPDDQRGVRRPQGPACDIGAVEAAPPPVAVNDSYSTPENTGLSVGASSGVLKNDSTITGGSLSASIVSNPAYGSVSLGSDGSFTYTPAAGYTGADSFTYKATDSFTNESANAIASMSVTTPARAVFPAMSNGAYGGYVTVATIQNIGSAAANVVIDYFNQNGAPVGAGDAIGSLPVNGSWTVRQDNGNSFPGSGGDATQAGSAVVYSSQPVAASVNEFAPGNVGDATSYSAVQVASGVGAVLYAPTIVNNAYGGYTTGIGLLNEGSGPTNVTITYRDGTGAVAKTQIVSALAAHAYQALYSGDATLALPSGFAGTATITSSGGQPLGAVVNEVGPGGQFSSYDAVPAGGLALNAPVALNNAFGGYYTGMGIQNTSAAAGSVTVTYYDTAGTPTVKSFSIPANGSLGVYQGSVTDGPAAGAYTATITSTVAVAAIVNEVAPSSTSAHQSTSYNAFGAGSSTLNLPLVENGGSDPWNTGEGIMNTGTAATTVTVTYYNAATGATVGTPQSQVVAPHAFWGLYQPTGGLPGGTRATAVITTSMGGQVAVICNESGTTTFMSYDAQ